MIAYQRGSDGWNSITTLSLVRQDFFGLPGANSKQLPSYINVKLENSNSDTVIIHDGNPKLENSNSETV